MDAIANAPNGASAELQVGAVERRQVTYPPLAVESRSAVDTETAAFHLNRRPQTLRCWAAYENGPIRPLRINGRLAWPTARLRELCGVSV
jgi:hypothetical protein